MGQMLIRWLVLRTGALNRVLVLQMPCQWFGNCWGAKENENTLLCSGESIFPDQLYSFRESARTVNLAPLWPPLVSGRFSAMVVPQTAEVNQTCCSFLAMLTWLITKPFLHMKTYSEKYKIREIQYVRILYTTWKLKDSMAAFGFVSSSC